MTATIQDTVHAALRDRNLWAEITATDAGRCEVYAELERLHRNVGLQITARSTELAARRDQVPADEYQRLRAQHRDWFARTMRFRQIVDERLGELRPAVAAVHRRLSDEANTYRELALKLAKTIYQHQAEEISDAGLYAVLTEVRLPNGVDGDITLFDLAARLIHGQEVLTDA